MNVGDRVASWLRTVVPGLWAVALAWLATRIPALGEWVHHPAVVGLGDLLAGAVALAIWYPFWRWLEPKLPDWLTTFVLGYPKPPVYQFGAAIRKH